ncbi:MATE family efflux transporter [Streptococcus sp. E29BA]|uniref:MATE family efflux transporter n=1 Tax=Streptococcus sp. E29BA TaxID=3278716 RepID=UPI00359DA416
MTTSQIDLTKGKILPTILRFAWPIMISNIFQQLYNTADTMIVGNYLGEQALAAVGSTSAIFELIIGFALGVGNGMGIVIARHYGAKNEEELKRSVVATAIIGLGLSGLVMLGGNLGLRPLLQLLGTPADILEQSYSYIYLIMMGVGVTFAYNLGAGLLRAIGDSLVALYFLIFSACLNIALDLFFITQLHLGVQSAGLATILSQGLSSVLCFRYIARRVPVLVPKQRHLVWDKGLYQDLLGQGLSMGLMFSIVSIGTVILQTAINGFGVLIIAAQTTARRIMAFSLQPLTATAASMTTFVSQNVGAKQFDRIYQGVKKASLIALVWGIIVTILLHIFSPALIRWISGSDEPELIANATLYLKLGTPFYPILGCLFILRNTLQGLGRKVTPLVSSLIELVGKVVFVIAIIPQVGYVGVMLCEPLIWVPMTAQLFVAFRRHPLIQEGKRQARLASV